MDKMKNLCWFLFLLPLLGLSACKSKADEPQTPGSYIACYLEPDSVRIIEMGHGTLDGEKTVMWRYSVDATESQDFYHRGSEKYQELSILYGDTAFYDNMLPEDNPNRIERSRLELPFLDFNLDGATASPSRDQTDTRIPSERLRRVLTHRRPRYDYLWHGQESEWPPVLHGEELMGRDR